MEPYEYRMTSEWRVDATPEEVAEVFRDSAALARWWPAVFLDARVVRPGDEREVGKVTEVVTKGWLPYVLRFRFVVEDADPSWGFTARTEGDFQGRGSCTYRS